MARKKRRSDPDETSNLRYTTVRVKPQCRTAAAATGQPSGVLPVADLIQVLRKHPNFPQLKSQILKIVLRTDLEERGEDGDNPVHRARGAG